MSPIRIYADFNGLVAGPKNPARTAVVLDTFGSLRDLSCAGARLQEDLPLIAVDASDDLEDLEGHGSAQFDFARRRWVVEFDDQGVRYVPSSARSTTTRFLCISCRIPVPVPVRSPAAIILQTNCCCPNCGTNILAAIRPPDAAA